jgi:hypothetical protein
MEAAPHLSEILPMVISPWKHTTEDATLARLFLSSDKGTLIGIAAVQNTSFQKLVVARFTLDCRKTMLELVIEYNERCSKLF